MWRLQSSVSDVKLLSTEVCVCDGPGIFWSLDDPGIESISEIMFHIESNLIKQQN